ncbi:hypothetical protein DPEC_G00215010 [Dallia pectoralis]|uniref:Uncharacterized protein n=1 Tax=Dallia pectoralis TaxID=75939 RepID=A0ACC2G2A8_DALPE|nr:hypothetical protein DPEC_G00215010 [Dallia pectoralis]
MLHWKLQLLHPGLLMLLQTPALTKCLAYFAVCSWESCGGLDCYLCPREPRPAPLSLFSAMVQRVRTVSTAHGNASDWLTVG